MTYGLSSTVTRLCGVIKGYMEDMTMKASEREELIATRKEVEQEVSQTRGVLNDVTNQLQTCRKQHESARKQTENKEV